MAGRKVYGGSDMTVLLHKEGITPHAALEALLAASSSSSSASPYAGFDVSGSGSILNFEGAGANAMNQQFYLPLEAGDDADDVDACLRQPEKKRRLTDDKLRSLEKSFELDNKLEPGRKIQLAKDLDLQPRQVAIWFQNRRARWKTKQLEKDYEALKSNYSALKVDYENLQKEKEKLEAEVIFLAEKVHVKEKEEEGAIEATQWKNSESISSGIEAKESETQMTMGVKQELDLSSTNNSSTIFDSESPPPPPPPPPPHCIEGGQNRLSSEAAASSSAEDEEVKGYHQWLKLEDNSHNFAFPVEDQALWFWPNYV